MGLQDGEHGTLPEGVAAIHQLVAAAHEASLRAALPHK